jgi:hypothetical protein
VEYVAVDSSCRLWLDLPRVRVHRGDKGKGSSPPMPKCFTCVLQVLLPAAGLLQLQDVKKTCCEFLESQLHPVNCLGIRAFADMHACTDLLNKANTYAGKCNRSWWALRLWGVKPLRSLWLHGGLWNVTSVFWVWVFYNYV